MVLCGLQEGSFTVVFLFRELLGNPYSGAQGTSSVSFSDFGVCRDDSLTYAHSSVTGAVQCFAVY